MSYTQWDKGFLEGHACGRKAGVRAVREALLNMKDYENKQVPIEYFELLNKLESEVNNE